MGGSWIEKFIGTHSPGFFGSRLLPWAMATVAAVAVFSFSFFFSFSFSRRGAEGGRPYSMCRLALK